MMTAIALTVLTLVLIAAGAVTLVIRQIAAARRLHYRDEVSGFAIASRMEKRREVAAGRRQARLAKALAARRNKRAGAHGMAFHGH